MIYHRVMGYYSGADVRSVNAGLALVEVNGKILRFDTEKVTPSPRAVVRSLIARLGEGLNLEEVVTAGGSGKRVIPRDLGWTQCSGLLAIASGLLHCYSDAKTIIQMVGQSALVIELERGLKKLRRVESNRLCDAGTGDFCRNKHMELGLAWGTLPA
ncbi:MAG: hypothetical protein ACUVTR_03910 [Dehalococcoidia bacterium]